jgi:predicted transcriptional regulator
MIDVKKANKNSDKLNLENRINYKLYKDEIDKLIKNNYIRKIGLIQKSYEITEKGYKILRWILFCQKVNKNGE